MRKIISIIITLCFFMLFKAQIAIGVTTDKEIIPHSSAIVDTDFVVNDKVGILFPKIAIKDSTDVSVIPAPADNLMVFSPTDNEFEGINYWNASTGTWKNIINHSRLYAMISKAHISQLILAASQTNPEAVSHVTDPNNVTPYIAPIDVASVDTQNGFDPSTYKYTIPETGVYQVTCNAYITNASATTGEIFIMKNTTTNTTVNLTTNLMSYVSPVTTFDNTVSMTATFNGGEKVYCSVGVGNYRTNIYRVGSSFISVVKY